MLAQALDGLVPQGLGIERNIAAARAGVEGATA
jgi:hypothetical protein